MLWSRRPSGSDDAILTAQLRLICSVALVLMIPCVFYFTTQGTWNLANEAMVFRVRLDVDPDDLLSECLRRGSRCNGYFGVTPSLVRIPFLPVSRHSRSALTPLFLGVALLLAYGAPLELLQRCPGSMLQACST